MWERSVDSGEIERLLAGFVFRDRKGKEIVSLETLTTSAGCTCDGFLVRSDWESWQELNADTNIPFDMSDAGPRLERLEVDRWCVEYREEDPARIWFYTDYAQYCLVEGQGAPPLQPAAAAKHSEMRQKAAAAPV